jgi:hypothetical protein
MLPASGLWLAASSDSAADSLAFEVKPPGFLCKFDSVLAKKSLSRKIEIDLQKQIGKNGY